MNIITTIKPSGVSERTTAGVGNIINDVLWSDPNYTWNDTGVMWSIGKFSNNAPSPKGIIKTIKP